MSRKGNCWDNAVAERFFLNLKMERVWQRNYANHAEAKFDVANYIAGFYNCERLHSVLGNLPPSVTPRATESCARWPSSKKSWRGKYTVRFLVSRASFIKYSDRRCARASRGAARSRSSPKRSVAGYVSQRWRQCRLHPTERHRIA